MSIEPKANDGSVEPTKAERTARDSVPESVEGAVPDPETKQAAITTRTTTKPWFPVMIYGGSEIRAADTFEAPDDDLDDASATELVEARQDRS